MSVAVPPQAWIGPVVRSETLERVSDAMIEDQVETEPASDGDHVEVVGRGRYPEARKPSEALTDGADELVDVGFGDPIDDRLRWLPDAGADPNGRDRRGRTALMHAALLGRCDVLEILLEREETDLELRDSDGNTALMHAAASGHRDAVALLLGQMGRLRQVLHLTRRNREGATALDVAERHGHASVAAALGGDRLASLRTERGADPSLSFPFRWRRRADGIERRPLGKADDGRRHAWPVTEDEGNATRTSAVPVGGLPALTVARLPEVGAGDSDRDSDDGRPVETRDPFRRAVELVSPSGRRRETETPAALGRRLFPPIRPFRSGRNLPAV